MPIVTRREFLQRHGGGLGIVALASMLGRDVFAGTESSVPSTAAGPGSPSTLDRAALNGGLHHRARATRCVQFFMSGAASQVDTFDYKPLLLERSGETWDPGGKVELFQSDPGRVMKSPWGWKQRGESGRWVSDLLPHLASQADRMAFVYSMVSKSNVHGPATFMGNTGFVLPGFPSMGAWVSHGLGSLNDNLPTFVVLPDSRGFPPNGPANWGAGFLPASRQATMIRPSEPNPVHDLFPPAMEEFGVEGEREGLALLKEWNKEHAATRESDHRLESRIESYELAAKLQLAAPEALDIANEPESVKKLYGLDDPVTADFGRNCLIARRLLERGVRFVQVWSGADNGFPRRNWDSHENLARDHADMGTSMDKPAAALLIDLERLGLLDETLVHWTSEFGRMPCAQGGEGRDHNPFAFTCWLAGGGVKGGTGYGASDEWSHKAVENPTYCYDIHATMLHLLGIDHERLTFRHNGIDRRLTDVHGHVIRELMG